MATAVNGSSGIAAAAPTRRRQSSLSSFPSSNVRSMSRSGRPGRSPQPPSTRDASESASISSNSTGAKPRIREMNSFNSPAAESGSGGVSRPQTRTRKRSAASNNFASRARPTRSQYPSDGVENHVEYILVASFDIDRGSVMEHQYPASISGDETMLAELMLPDQAHVRSQDWTIFFLHKDVEAEEATREERRELRREKREGRRTGRLDDGNDLQDAEEASSEDESTTQGDDDDDGFEGPPLIYVLNLVNTKQDNTVKRGAVVKAMAICTRHSFLHIYKPILLLALEDYFRTPTMDTIATLYDAVNSMDLSLMPHLNALESHILQATDAKDMFVEKFAQLIKRRMAQDAKAAKQLPPNSDPPPMPHYSLPRDTHEFESAVMYNKIRVPIKVPTAVPPEQVGDFSLIKLISTFAGPHQASPQPFTTHPHLTTSGAYTHPIIVLLNALLTQKRIIFLGHNRPSGEVAEAVLAACALASGDLLRGFTRHAFPYTDLTKVDDLLKVPGFIAGVTNPAFANKPEWWDLLCDIPSGRMKISNRIEGPPITDGLLYFQQQNLQLPSALTGGGANGVPLPPGASTSSLTLSRDSSSAAGEATGDTAFMESVLSSISSRHGEAAVRHKFRNWVRRFTRVAAAFEELVYGASALYIGANSTDSDAGHYGVSGHGSVWPEEPSRSRELAANVSRIEGWRNTRSYYSLIQDLARCWERTNVVRCLDLSFQLERLRTLRLSHEVTAAIYLAIAKAVEEGGAGERGVLAGLNTRSNSISTAESGSKDDGTAVTDEDDSESLEDDGYSDSIAASIDLERRRYTVILQLLTALPDGNSGLFYISLGLFHPRPDVREEVVLLLERIRDHEAGKQFWASLGRFAKLAFYRMKREMEQGKADVRF